MNNFPKTPNELLRMVFSKKILFKYHMVVLFGAIVYAILSFRIYTFKFLIDPLADKDVNGFYFGLVFLIFVVGFGYFLEFLERRMRVRLSVEFASIMRKFNFKHIVQYPYDFFASNLSGKIVSDMRSLDYLEMWYKRVNSQKIVILELLIILGITFYTNFYVGLSFILFSFLLSFLYKNQTSKIRELSVVNNTTGSIFKGRIFDFLANISVVRLFNVYKEEDLNLEKFHETYKKASISLYIQKHKFNLYGSFLLFFLEVLVTFYMIHLIKLNLITIGDFSITVMYMNMFNSRFLRFVRYEAEVRDLQGGIESGLSRLFVEIHNQDPEFSEGIPLNSNIRVENLCLNLSNKKIFKNLNLEIKEGEKVGLVGVSGAGKTTLVETLMRLHDIDSGMVFVGDKDITQLKLADLLDTFGIVDQNTLLYNDSIEYNLTLGRKFTDKQIKNALKKAYLSDFVQDQPKGLKTIVGERGVRLSGGQKQRLGIARAILFDAPILILDEATASLDSKSEEVIQNSIENLIQNKTVIAIAHRLSTLDIMDRILVMKKGKIVEDGSQKELLNKKGAYFELYTNQNDKFY